MPRTRRHGTSSIETGRLRSQLGRFPSQHLNAQGLGHGPKIGAVRFSAADKFLISVGEGDGCAFQWELVYPVGEDIAAIEETDDK